MRKNISPAKPKNSSLVKHREVAQALQREIDSQMWSADERLPGELELARRFEVAHMTVRQAIANLVDEGILVRVRGKGTYVVPKDRQTNTGRTLHPMALLFPSDAQQRDPYYFPELLEGFKLGMEEAGRTAVIYGDEVSDPMQFLEPGAAVACLLFSDGHMEKIERLRDNGLRVLAINRYSGRRSIPSVSIDDAAGIGKAVEHLAELGHERIGFVCGPSTNFDAQDRLRGFRSAVKRCGIRFAPEAGDGFNEAAGYAAALQLLNNLHRPTALVCASDLSSLGAIKAARDLGLSVPRGLSIVGFGDFSVADYMLPALTTVRQARLALGRAAAAALIELASGANVANVVLDPDLILRESTAENHSAIIAAR